jgi:DNA-directed RNA polymerase subunit K/omega
LQKGARPLIQTSSTNAAQIAQAEVQAGLVPIRVEEPDKLALPRKGRT